MAKQSHTPSRRAMLAGLAAAPVAGLPTIAGVVAEADPVFAAIERHKAVWAAYCAASDDDERNRMCLVENDALMELAETPCASDTGFFAKLKYLIGRHDALWAEAADSTECPDILAAIRRHTEAQS